MAGERETGTVKRYDPERGFGFIARRGADDLFLHRSDLERSGITQLNPGDRVSFTIKQGPRGLQAANVLLEDGSPTSAAAPSAAPRSAPQVGPAQTVARPSTATNFRFGPDYLADGYFKQTADGSIVRPEILDTLAMDVAKVLGNRGMKSNQLRKFFTKARGIEFKLDREKNFAAIKADIYGFKRDVAYQVGRKMVPDEFQQFITRNVELAVEDEQSFRKGFLQHFESVLAYFVYFFRER